MDLKRERAKIDLLDQLLVETMAKRIKIAVGIQTWRRKSHLRIKDPPREDEIQTKVKSWAKHRRIDHKFAASLIQKIIAEGKKEARTKTK